MNQPPQRSPSPRPLRPASQPVATSPTTTIRLDDLPEEVLLLVLSFLPPASLVRLSLLSLRWHVLLHDATLWRGKLAECMPQSSAARLQRLQATVVRADDEDGEGRKRLDDEWIATCQRLGFNKTDDPPALAAQRASSPSSSSIEDEVSDLHRLYTSDEADHEGDSAAPSVTIEAAAMEPPTSSATDCTESPQAVGKSEGQATQANDEEAEQSKERHDEPGKPSVARRKEDWRYACLALLNTEKNWYRGDIRPIHRIPISADVLCLDFDEEQQLLVTGSKDGSRGEISVWHLRTGEQLFSFEGHRWWVNDVHLRDDRVFSCSNDATVTVWGIKERSSMKILPGHGAGVQSISFHPHQSHILLSGSWDNTVKLWDVNTSELLGTFDFAGHTSGEQAWAVSISEKGMMLGVGQAGWLCAWDYRQRTPIFAYQPEEMRHSVGTFRYRTGFHCVQFNEAGDRCIVAGSHLPTSDPSAVDAEQKDLDGIIQEYDLSSGEPHCLRTFKGTNSSVRAIQFDQGKLVAGDFDSRIKASSLLLFTFSVLALVWDLATGTLQTNFKNWLPVSFEPSPNFENRIFKLKYSPTGLMVTGESTSIGVWDLSGRRKPRLTSRTPPSPTLTDTVLQ